jgi:hypothetical protein
MALFRLRRGGSVVDVRLLRSGGDPEWDRGAVDSMMTWRFSAVHRDSAAPDFWVRYSVVVEPAEMVTMILVELVASSESQADSLHTLLKSGGNIDYLAAQTRLRLNSGPVGSLGEVDISRYHKRVREELSRLRVNEVAPPIRIGRSFYIYKGLPPERQETGAGGQGSGVRGLKTRLPPSCRIMNRGPAHNIRGLLGELHR